MRRAVAPIARQALRQPAAVSGVRAFSSQFPPYVLNAPATEVATLPNGLRVASEGGHGDTATIGVFIDAGSRYETAANNGTAHFLEHMIFKGTKNRGQTELELEFENMGGHLNAYTSREFTVYQAKVFKNDVPKAVEILADIVQNSKLDDAAIDLERRVILREMEEVNSQQEEVIFDQLHDVAFPDSGLGRTILGPTENILKITRDDLESYIKTHYSGPRVVVAGAGAVDHEQLVSLADTHLGSLPKEAPANTTVPDDRAIFRGADIRTRDDTMPLAHVALSVEGAEWTSPYAFPLMVMQTMLGSWDRTVGAGGNMSSRLCQNVGQKDLAHSLTAFNTCYKDTGLFGVYAIAEPHKLNDLMYHTLHCMVSMCHHTSEEDVARARTQLKSQLLMQLDGSSAVCDEIGRQMIIYGRRLTPAELFARIDAVDATAVKGAAELFINDRDVAVSAIGPIHELPDYNWLRRRTHWHRF